MAIIVLNSHRFGGVALVPGARPAFADAGASLANATTGAGPFAPVWPATVNIGNLGLLVASLKTAGAGTALALTAGAIADGWTQIAHVQSADTLRAVLIAYKIADGDEDGAAMVGGYDKTGGNDSADITFAQILRFTAADGFASTPYEDLGTGEFSGTTYSGPSITPGGVNRLGIAIAAASDDAAAFVAFTGATGGTWAEILDDLTSLGSDAQHQVQAVDIDGTISGGSATVGNLSYLTAKFALAPPLVSP